MTTETRSHNWPLIIIVVLLGFLAVAIFSALELKRKLYENLVSDSTQFNAARKTIVGYIQREEFLLKALDKSQDARKAENDYYNRRDSAKLLVIRRLKRDLAAVNTSRATVPELDSLQLGLYGPPPDDSLHTIPLDYSRKLTGDALRLPIEQRLADTWHERHDSLESHAVRIIGSMTVDLEMMRQDKAADHETITGLMGNVETMQGQLNDQGRKFRRIRRRERIVEGLIVVGVVILAL
jgi:hypothetical protein